MRLRTSVRLGTGGDNFCAGLHGADIFLFLPGKGEDAPGVVGGVFIIELVSPVAFRTPMVIPSKLV